MCVCVCECARVCVGGCLNCVVAVNPVCSNVNASNVHLGPHTLLVVSTPFTQLCVLHVHVRVCAWVYNSDRMLGSEWA